MIGKTVQYKDSDDKKQYYVVDFFEDLDGYEAEICILVDYTFYPNIIKQLRTWQKLSCFDIVED